MADQESDLRPGANADSAPEAAEIGDASMPSVGAEPTDVEIGLQRKLPALDHGNGVVEFTGAYPAFLPMDSYFVEKAKEAGFKVAAYSLSGDETTPKGTSRMALKILKRDEVSSSALADVLRQAGLKVESCSDYNVAFQVSGIDQLDQSMMALTAAIQ